MAVGRKLPKLPFAAGALVVLAAMAAIAYWTYRNTHHPTEAELLESPPCDLNGGPCAAPLPGGGQVTLAITPSPIPVMTPFKMVVTTTGFTATRVAVDFAGVDMDMGLLRLELQSAGEGRFQGETLLPVCVSGRMRWRATLLLEAHQGAYRIPYHFEAPLARH